MDPKSILLVDDELLLRKSLEANLKGEGYDVVSAASGEQAMTYLQGKSFDLLLSDLLMEEITGRELLIEARKLQPRIKVIIFSGYTDKNSADEIIGLGADDFFCKPIDFGELIKRISIVLNRKRATSD